MVDMQLSNDKLIVRGTKMIQKELSISEQHALDLLTTYKSVRNAINNYKTNDNQAH
jgi:N-acetylmuramic acid 6-phosphate etherase